MDAQDVLQPTESTVNSHPNGSSNDNGAEQPAARKERSDSISQRSEDSQTAADFLRDQMQLEADAREALPYSIEHCTNALGSLRQAVFSCLTCNPPPANTTDPYNAAGVCYACSVQCHGEHELVEIFTKRNFTCDCGTTRLPATSPCSLRINPETNTKGGVHTQEPSANNKYNQNFRNRFCGCECDYDPFQQKGTMFQCLGLGTTETGGCGEDWYHPGCLVGLGPKWYENGNGAVKPDVKEEVNTTLPTISEDPEAAPAPPQTNGDANPTEEDDDDVPPPPGFPADDDFDSFICYKCVEAYPWIKRYAGTPGFLPPVFLDQTNTTEASATAPKEIESKKRKASPEDEDMASQTSKRPKSEAPSPPAEPSSAPPTSTLPNPSSETTTTTTPPPTCLLPTLPSPPTLPFSLFLTPTFRSSLCRCPTCFPLLTPHPQLLEEEETYEPPVSEDGSAPSEGGSSLLERGESALRNVDRVRAIEGVMAYNHMKEKLKPFFKEFAESGKAISAEDIKAWFAKLRGDEEGEREAREGVEGQGGGGGDGDGRKEGEGY